MGLLSSYSLRFAPDFSASLTFSLFSVARSPFSTSGQVLKGESNSLFVFKDKITRYQRKIAFSSKLKASTLRIQIVGKKSHRLSYLFLSNPSSFIFFLNFAYITNGLEVKSPASLFKLCQ